MDVSIGVLGPLVVTRAGVPVTLDRAAWRRVLLVLVVHDGRFVDDAALLDACWGDRPPRTATATLRTYVSHLRRQLGADTIQREGPGYRLTLPRDAIDAVRFERGLERGRAQLRAGSADEAAVTLRGALACWRGPALADVADEPFARLEANRLDERRLDAEEALLEARLAGADPTDASADARALAEAAPARERRWVLLLRSLGAAGRVEEGSEVYREVRERLVDELGVEPGPALRAEHRRLLAGEGEELLAEPQPRAGSQADAATIGVPVTQPADAFVGREELLAHLRERSADHRLVTLTGPGGSGKTRLAVQLAIDHDGPAWFVDLAAVTDPVGVPAAVRAAVGGSHRPGLSELEAAAIAMTDPGTLVVLDNCEHLVEAAGDAATWLLANTADLRLLATSRAPLEVPGEQRIPVPPLDLPEEDASDESEAVLLFATRARAVDPSFTLSPAIRTALVRLCRQLDGMPLAIELAAARTAHLSVEELADRLDDRFSLLVRRGGDRRHRTLRGTLDWSHELLSPAERALFRRLAVFVGSFSLGSASAVHGADAMAELTALVDHSLVVADPHRAGGRRRYRLLESMRAYAAELLAASGEEDTIRERHLAEVRRFAHLHAPSSGWPSPGAAGEANAERGNIRAAVGWALQAGRERDALELCSDLAFLADVTGWFDEPRRWLEEALAAAEPIDDALRMRSLQAVAWLAAGQSDYPRAAEAAEAAADLAARLGAELWRAWALDVRANAAWNTGAWDEALALYEELLPVYRAADETQEQVGVLQCIAAVAYRRGDYGRAASLLDEARALHGSAGEAPEWWRYDFGILAGRLGQYRRAEEHLTASLRHAERYGDDTAIGASMRDLAALAANEGRLEDALELARDSVRRHRRTGERWGEAASLQVLARATLLAGDPDAAAALARDSLALFERLGDDWGAAGSGIILARAAPGTDARTLLDRARARAEQLGDPWLVAEALDVLADLLLDEDAVSAAAASGEADAIRAAIGAPLPPSERPRHAARLDRLAASLGTEELHLARLRGADRAPSSRADTTHEVPG
jgi:predicted ATPase/DNA-binding SARP family transcriptional activator